jgi:hypothetical protein
MTGGMSDDALSKNVHQAVGMVAAQVGCDVDEALARLKIRADAMGQTLEHTALDVLDRVIRFDE